MQDAGDALARLVGDHRGFARAFGLRPLHLAGRGRFDDLLDTDDVEAVLRHLARRPSFRLVRDGPTIAVGDVTMPAQVGGVTVEDVADLDRIVRLVADGATVVLQGLQHTWPPLRRFCRDLETATSHRVQANAYLSPANARALGRHADTHDVLAVQVEGAKRWDVEGLGEVELEEGDVLYVPAGTPHDAASGDRPSLHVAFGLLTRTRRQATLSLVDRLLDDVAGADHPLPLGFATPAARDELRDDLANCLRQLTAALASAGADAVAMHAAAVEVDRVERRRDAPLPDGALRAVLDPGAVSPGTRLRLRHGVRVECLDDGAVVADQRRRLTVPAVAVGAVDALGRAGELRVDALPGLDAESQLVLARRLVRDGFALPDDRPGVAPPDRLSAAFAG